MPISLSSTRYDATFAHYINTTTSLIVCTVDERLRITACNQAFLDMINCPQDIIGHSILDFLSDESNRRQPFTEMPTMQTQRLVFIAADNASYTLDCFLARIDNTYLLIGAHLMLTRDEIVEKMTVLSNELIDMTRELHTKQLALEEAHAQIKVLSGIIPICMHCKKIRDDQGYWTQLEQYISEHSDALFSHGICPKCLEQYDDES